MKRMATITKLKPGMKKAYQKLHDEIWDEVVAANHKYNMRNFNIFCCGDYLFSYYEYIGDDFEGDASKKNALPIIIKWRETTGAMTEFVCEDTKVIPLEQLWHHDF